MRLVPGRRLSAGRGKIPRPFPRRQRVSQRFQKDGGTGARAHCYQVVASLLGEVCFCARFRGVNVYHKVSREVGEREHARLDEQLVHCWGRLGCHVLGSTVYLFSWRPHSSRGLPRAL